MSLNKFLKDYYPKIYEEYKRFKKKEILPEIGDVAIPVREGFGRYGTLKVIAHVKKNDISENGSVWADDYIVLRSEESTFLSKPSEWWRDFKYIKSN